MFKVAVLGDRDSVLGFRALGLDVFPAEQTAEAAQQLHALAKEKYAVIYVTETLACQIPQDIARYKDEVMPAIILIPGKSGSLGIGMASLQSSVERAVGVDIFSAQNDQASCAV